MVDEDSHCLPLVSSLIVMALALLRWIEPIQLCEEMEHWAVSVATRWEANLRNTSSDFSSELFSVASVCNEDVPTHLSWNSCFLTVSLLWESQRNTCVCGEDTCTFTWFVGWGRWSRMREGNTGRCPLSDDHLCAQAWGVPRLYASALGLIVRPNSSWDGDRLWLDWKCFSHEWD